MRGLKSDLSGFRTRNYDLLGIKSHCILPIPISGAGMNPFFVTIEYSSSYPVLELSLVIWIACMIVDQHFYIFHFFLFWNHVCEVEYFLIYIIEVKSKNVFFLLKVDPIAFKLRRIHYWHSIRNFCPILNVQVNCPTELVWVYWLLTIGRCIIAYAS